MYCYCFMIRIRMNVPRRLGEHVGKVTISRMSADALQDEAWTFRLISDASGSRIVIERYVRFIRQSKRHRWQTAARYDVYSNKGRTLTKPVTPPEDVAREALDTLLNRIRVAMEQLLRKLPGAPRPGEPLPSRRRAVAA